MKRLSIIIVFVFFFCLTSSALAGVREKLEKIGFPEEITVSLAQLVEQKSFLEKIDVPKGTEVSAIIRNDEAEREVLLNWSGNHQFKAEKYEAGGFVLYRLVNRGTEVFFRIGELPELKKAEVASVVLPILPSQGEEKMEVVKTDSIPIQKTEGNGVEEVYEAMALPLDLKNLTDQSLTAIVIPIHQSRWIGDGLGKYTITKKEGQEVEIFLVRKVWRAYIGGEIFPAVITKFGTHLFLITQGKNKTDLVGKSSVIISGSGKFALTLSGKMVEFDLKKFEESAEYQNTFFEKNPSEVREEMLVDISPNTENGKMFLADLRKIFPNDYYVKGRLISTETDEETLKNLVGSSNNASYMRRVVEKGGLPSISISSVACPPCELARMLIVWTLAAFDDSLNGNFFEAKVSGYQAAQAMAPYLAECQEEITYLAKNLQGGR